MNFIGGVDEAGRGPVLCSLVICYAFCKRTDEKKLKSLAKKDSKQLTPNQRVEILAKLRKFVEFKCAEITAEQLNELMNSSSLNDIEAKFMAGLIKKHQNDCDIMIDMPDRYSWTFRQRMKKFGAQKFEAEHKADENYPIVAAASICAKVLRDSLVEEAKKETGIDFGSGYPSDPKTIAALKDRKTAQMIKKYIRTKWKTLENIKQTKLFEGEDSGKSTDTQ